MDAPITALPDYLVKCVVAGELVKVLGRYKVFHAESRLIIDQIRRMPSDERSERGLRCERLLLFGE